MAVNRPDSVTDFGQFTGLRAAARNDDAAVVRKAAQQFEALFTQQMLKSMRAAKLGEDVMGGGQTEFYQDLFDQQMAVHLSSGKGLGLADVLVAQLRGHQAGGDAAAPAPAPASTTTRSGMKTLGGGAPSGFGAVTHSRLSRDTAPGDAEGDAARADFVRGVWPHAERAARALGVSPRVLVAQAALETGWGRHAAGKADGTASFNFFGIKADKSWQGADVKTQTTEYVDGQPQREDAHFRVYGSAAQSFDDYVDFLKSNPRYADALRHNGDMRHFVQGLQNAGYATDPAYAQKILKIADGQAMRAALTATADPSRGYGV